MYFNPRSERKKGWDAVPAVVAATAAGGDAAAHRHKNTGWGQRPHEESKVCSNVRKGYTQRVVCT